jgi:hypothetical protein
VARLRFARLPARVGLLRVLGLRELLRRQLSGVRAGRRLLRRNIGLVVREPQRRLVTFRRSVRAVLVFPLLWLFSHGVSPQEVPASSVPPLRCAGTALICGFLASQEPVWRETMLHPRRRLACWCHG